MIVQYTRRSTGRSDALPGNGFAESFLYSAVGPGTSAPATVGPQVSYHTAAAMPVYVTENAPLAFPAHLGVNAPAIGSAEPPLIHRAQQ